MQRYTQDQGIITHYLLLHVLKIFKVQMMIVLSVFQQMYSD